MPSTVVEISDTKINLSGEGATLNLDLTNFVNITAAYKRIIFSVSDKAAGINLYSPETRLTHTYWYDIKLDDHPIQFTYYPSNEDGVLNSDGVTLFWDV